MPAGNPGLWRYAGPQRLSGIPWATKVHAHGTAAQRPLACNALLGFTWNSTDVNGGTPYECRLINGVPAWVQSAAGVSAAASAITALTGDVTASGPGSAAATIANNAVTFAKMQTVLSGKLLGSSSAGSAIQAINVGSGLTMNVDTLEATGGGSGTVTSITAGSGLAGGTITTSGTIDLDFTNLSAFASPIALDDVFAMYDTSATAMRKLTAQQLLGALPPICTGRLTPTSGTAVTTSDVTGAGTLYFTPYNGSLIALHNGTYWQMHTFTERSLSLTLTSGKNYDVFIYDNSGTLTLELSSAWTDDTTRNDPLTTQDGVLVKSGAPTRRYLGTIRASGSNTTEDSAAKRFVWNMYNREPRYLLSTDSSDRSNTSATYAQVGSVQIAFVIGIAGQSVSYRGHSDVYQGTSGSYIGLAIGSSTSAVMTGCVPGIDRAIGTNVPTSTLTTEGAEIPSNGLTTRYLILNSPDGTGTAHAHGGLLASVTPGTGLFATIMG